MNDSIRELEGALTRLKFFSNLTNGRAIDMVLAEEALKQQFTAVKKQITPEGIINAVAEYYGSVTPAEITGSSRRREVAVPRQIAMFLTRELAGMSLPQIGQAFGGRDHTTVLYSCNLVADKLKDDTTTANVVDEIRRRIRNER